MNSAKLEGELKNLRKKLDEATKELEERQQRNLDLISKVENLETEVFLDKADSKDLNNLKQEFRQNLDELFRLSSIKGGIEKKIAQTEEAYNKAVQEEKRKELAELIRRRDKCLVELEDMLVKADQIFTRYYGAQGEAWKLASMVGGGGFKEPYLDLSGLSLEFRKKLEGDLPLAKDIGRMKKAVVD